MKKLAAGMVAFGLAALVTSTAMAQDSSGLPAEGSFVIGAERMFGFYSYKGTAEYSANGVDYKSEQSGTQFSLLWGANGTGGEGMNNPNAIPRIGVDYFITDMISLGGSLGYYSASGEEETTQNGQSDSDDLPDISGFALAPRVGFLFPFGDGGVAFWLRAGLTHYQEKLEEGDYERTASLQQINAEGMFVISPVDHFAFVLGPVIDFGVAGTLEQKEDGNSAPDIDLKWTNFGGVVGIAGYL